MAEQRCIVEVGSLHLLVPSLAVAQRLQRDLSQALEVEYFSRTDQEVVVADREYSVQAIGVQVRMVPPKAVVVFPQSATTRPARATRPASAASRARLARQAEQLLLEG